MFNSEFSFNGKNYKYSHHKYNNTYIHERIVEVSLAKEIINKYKNKNILEVGNVMKHYINSNHTVLDKHEVAPGVINDDVINFKPKRKFDLIISVSTLEHVGHSFGEEYNTKKFNLAVKNLKLLLRRKGLIFVTLPLFYNDVIDKLIVNDKFPFESEYFMKRISPLNKWIQIDKKEALKGPKYDEIYSCANVLYIATYRKK